MYWIVWASKTINKQIEYGKFKTTANPEITIDNEKYNPIYVNALFLNILCNCGVIEENIPDISPSTENIIPIFCADILISNKRLLR